MKQSTMGAIATVLLTMLMQAQALTLLGRDLSQWSKEYCTPAMQSAGEFNSTKQVSFDIYPVFKRDDLNNMITLFPADLYPKDPQYSAYVRRYRDNLIYFRSGYRDYSRYVTPAIKPIFEKYKTPVGFLPGPFSMRCTNKPGYENPNRMCGDWVTDDLKNKSFDLKIECHGSKPDVNSVTLVEVKFHGWNTPQITREIEGIKAGFKDKGSIASAPANPKRKSDTCNFEREGCIHLGDVMLTQRGTAIRLQPDKDEMIAIRRRYASYYKQQQTDVMRQVDAALQAAREKYDTPPSESPF